MPRNPQPPADETPEETANAEIAVSENGTAIPYTLNGIPAPASVRSFVEYIRQRAEVESTIVAKSLAVDQMAQIMEATTPEELDAAMRFAGVKALKEFEAGTEIEIRGFHASPGTREEFKNSLEVFVVMDCILLETGQNVMIDTGIERIIAFLRASEVMERFPLRVRVVTQQTGRGNDMFTLLPIPKRVETGTAESVPA